MGDSVLGALADRIKTDVRVPEDLSETVEELCAKLGMTKNAFYVVGAVKFAAEIAGVAYEKRTQRRVLTALKDQIQRMLDSLEGS